MASLNQQKDAVLYPSRSCNASHRIARSVLSDATANAELVFLDAKAMGLLLGYHSII